MRRMLSGVESMEHRDDVEVKLGWFGQCSVYEAKAPAEQSDL